MNQTITVEYRTRKDCCSCCGQELKQPQISQIKKFIFSKDNCLEWMDKESWRIEKEDDDGFQSIVEEFAYETIDFFATGSDVKILIEDSESSKVKEFILNKIIKDEN